MSRKLFDGKKFLIMGLGRFGGGVDCARFVARLADKVIVTDLADEKKLAGSVRLLEGIGNIELHLGGHKEEDFAESDIIIVNPAVPPSSKFLQIARDNKKLITSQIEIFFQLCPAPIIGITGSNGKSTTTALTAHLLKAGQKKVWLSGNIGNRPLLEILDEITKDDLIVLELSSFQLEQLVQIKKSPDIAVITNLTPNHLDRHGSFENYCDAKENIFRFQKTDGISIFNAEDTIASKWHDKYSDSRSCIKFAAGDVPESLAEAFGLPGRFNLANLAAAISVAKHFGLPEDKLKKAIGTFQSLPHRLELVAEVNAICWYNDSISTTPESTIAALGAFAEPVILIAGGYDKGIDFAELGGAITEKCKAVLLLGATAKKIAASIDGSRTNCQFTSSLAEAVELAEQIARPGDIVLLSPACASYDMFDNFQHRGQIFRQLVGNLK